MTDQQLPDRNGDIIADIEIALTRQGDLSDEHHAFYSEIVHRFEALTSERDRLRTAWESARRGRAQAYRQLDDARRWGRILEAQRKDLRREVRAESARVSALRIAYQAAKDAGLPEADMAGTVDEVTSAEEIGQIVDDSVEIGAQSMREWVERLDRDLSETTKVITQRLATVEDRLGITDEEPPAPARYRDRGGDLWEQDADNPDRYILTQWRDGSSVGHQLTRTLDALRDGYGPLTPATRLGRPTTTTGDTK